jgi:hypothetical protein
VETSADVAKLASMPFEDPVKANPYLFAIGGGNLHVHGIGAVSGDWAVVGFADDSELLEFV